MSRQSAGVNLPVTHKEITHTLSLSLSLCHHHIFVSSMNTQKKEEKNRKEKIERLWLNPPWPLRPLLNELFLSLKREKTKKAQKLKRKKLTCRVSERDAQCNPSRVLAYSNCICVCVCVCAYYACTVLTSQSSQVQGLFRCFLPASFILITLAEKCLWIKRREEEEEEKEEKKKKFIDRNADDCCFFFKFYFVFFVVFGIMRIPLPLLTDSDLVEWMNENGSRGSSLPAWPGPARPSPALSLVVKNGPSDA